MMAEQSIPSEDVAFALYDQLKIQQLFETPQFPELNMELCRMILTEARRLAVGEFLPANATGDREGAQFSEGRVQAPPSFHRPYRIYVDGGWIAMTEAAQMGGQDLPRVIAQAADEYFRGGNVALLMYGTMCHGTGRMIELFGTEKQKSLYVKRLYKGQWGGTMLLTEPEAGSDVGNLSTRAVRNADGTYTLTGHKIFITNGEQDLTENIVHPVLARVKGAPSGTKGLSLFIVSKFRLDARGNPTRPNDIRCIGIEKKMGLHGSPTCSMVLGENGECVGELLGQENQGIEIMFHMMNETRLMMGASGCAIASVAYSAALAHARQRTQGADPARGDDPEAPRVPIIAHPDVRRMLLEMKTFSEAMRSFVYYVAFLFDRARCASDSEEKERLTDLIGLLTPIVKSYCSDKGFWACNQAMMVHGGAGYTRDYPVEQWLRDVKISAIVEGTNGIQAIDFLGRKLRMKKGRAFEDLLKEIGATTALSQSDADLGGLKEMFDGAVAVLVETARSLTGKKDIRHAFLFAHPLLDAAGDVIMAWMLLWRALAARKSPNASSRFAAAQIRGAHFFIKNRLPVTLGKMSAIREGSLAAMEMEDSEFGG